jgi:hypothetical protein
LDNPDRQRCALAALSRVAGGHLTMPGPMAPEAKQYGLKYERGSTTKGPARGRKQTSARPVEPRPREFRHGLLARKTVRQFNGS